MEHQNVPSIFDDASQNFRTNCMGFASFAILIWDHTDTFTEEVEYIWNGEKSPLVYLFLVNRYLTPLGFIVNLFAYLSLTWTPERCSHFIRFEGSMTIIGIEIVALMMLLRINALYLTQKWVVGCVASLLLAETTMNAWLMTKGEAVLHNPQSGIRACTMIFDPEISAIASSSAWIPLLYDSIILGLTLYRSIRHPSTNHILKRLREDGLIYYSVICSITLVLTIMIVVAPPGLKNIVAQMELLLTVAMMSRITLSLKKTARKVVNGTITVRTSQSLLVRNRNPSVSSGRSHAASLSTLPNLFIRPSTAPSDPMQQQRGDYPPPQLQLQRVSSMPSFIEGRSTNSSYSRKPRDTEMKQTPLHVEHLSPFYQQSSSKMTSMSSFVQDPSVLTDSSGSRRLEDVEGGPRPGYAYRLPDYGEHHA